MLGNLGYVELSIGDIDVARGHLLESLDIARALNDHYGGGLRGPSTLGLATLPQWLSGVRLRISSWNCSTCKRMQMKQSIAARCPALDRRGHSGQRRGTGWPGLPGSTVQPSKP